LLCLEIRIRPESGFSTPLKGDTVFGQVCCEICYNPKLAKKNLAELIELYDTKPFLVISSAFIRLNRNGKFVYLFKRPDIPFDSIKGEKVKSKDIKRFKWIMEDDGFSVIDFHNMQLREEAELIDEFFPLHKSKYGVTELKISTTQMRNTINRLTSTTGDPPFTPFPTKKDYYLPRLELCFIALLDTNLMEPNGLIKALENIGKTGFGADASVGYGRFEIVDYRERPIPFSKEANAMYLLSPCVPPAFEGEIYYMPFVRFGKHGRAFSRGRPFKNPVVMADEGAVLVPKDRALFQRPFVGRPARNVSKSCPEAVVQGYSPYIPAIWSAP
jgi:CRISPR-associated protein Csm4